MTDNPTIQQYRTAYSAAETAVKKVEYFTSEVAVPAVNELRHAGYHFILATDDDGNLTDPGELQKALSHCQRARHDAAAAGIIEAIGQIRSVSEKYPGVIIGNVIPGWNDIMVEANEADDHLVDVLDETQKRPSSDEQMEVFGRLQLACRQIRAAHDDLNTAYDNVTAAYDEKIERRRRHVRSIAVAIGLGLFSAAVIIAVRMCV